jgi:hypothetical protein
MNRACLALFVLFASAAMLGQTVRLPTLAAVDEAGREPSLRGVRQTVLKAVAERDVDALVSIVSAKARNEGSLLSAEWLRSVFTDPNFEWWSQLRDALTHGGAFTTSRGAVDGRREFCAPYAYAAFPSEIPAVVHGERPPYVVIGKNVAVHAKPDARSRVLARLSHVLVQAPGAEYPDKTVRGRVWKAIEYPDSETEGFILASQIRDPEGFHVCFAPEGGQWRISEMQSHGVVAYRVR